jgi:nitroreductase
MNSVMSRRSIRKYTDKKISDETVRELLKAAMAAPSAGNQQPWEFIVLRDKEVMSKIIEVHKYATMLKEAEVAIVVCGDEAKEKFKGYWVQDCSAATENILIEAQELGLGGVWLGVYPMEDRVEALKEILNIPSSVTPLSIVSLGYPGESKDPADRYDETRIHFDRW